MLVSLFSFLSFKGGLLHTTFPSFSSLKLSLPSLLSASMKANLFFTYLSATDHLACSHTSPPKTQEQHPLQDASSYFHLSFLTQHTCILLLVQGASTSSKFVFTNTVLKDKDLPSYSLFILTLTQTKLTRQPTANWRTLNILPPAPQGSQPFPGHLLGLC